MAQMQHQQFSQSFSPPVSSPSPSASSPVNGTAPPPPKRQRMSPLPLSQPQSPYASPSFGTLQLPQGQPLSANGTIMNGMGSGSSSQLQGAMGPPSRPVERATDATELTDVLAGSGIDVREEEAFLTHNYQGPAVPAQPIPRSSQQLPNASFTSQASSGGPISATSSSTNPVQPKSSTQGHFYNETLCPQVPRFRDPNERTREDCEAARRAQYHLQDPFLLIKVLEQRLRRRGVDLGVRVPSEGLFHPVGRPQPIEVTGPDGSSVVRNGQTILSQEGAPLVDILNLMSLSCEERLRNVLDYSSSLARSRRAHSHGVVPAEWRKMALPVGSTDGNVESAKTSLKRSKSAADMMPKPLIDKVRTLMDKDAACERIRISKRAKRSASAILGDDGVKPDSTGAVSPGIVTPVSDRAPATDKKGMTKKEVKRMIDARMSEAQQHQQSVETARLATNSMLSGRVFGTKKSYSWLNRGTSTPSGFATPPPRHAVGTPSGGGDKPGRVGEPTFNPDKQLGSWREDERKGTGIQVRDILYMLEMDRRGRKHIQKAYAKDVKEDLRD